MLAGQLALVIAALFSGAAIYVPAVEHIAREQLDDRAQLTQWKPSYKRGAVMQASLALLGTIAGAIAWYQTGSLWFAAGAIALLLPWPWTLIVIKPTNDRLLATPLESAGPETRALIAKWGKLHLMRMALGIAGLVCFFLALFPAV